MKESNWFDSDGYRLDDLQIGSFRLLQDKRRFCLTTDSVLLAEFASRACPKNARVAEAGCGNGAVSILMAARREDIRITGIEISEADASLARYNCELNGLKDRFEVITGDIRDVSSAFTESFDIFVVNPPYVPAGKGLASPCENVAGSRSEGTLTFSEAAQAARRMLKNRGRFIFVNKASRLDELIVSLSENRLSLKTLRFVHSKKSSPAYLLYGEAVKNGGRQVTVEPPLVLHGEDGSYTDEVYGIYHMEKR